MSGSHFQLLFFTWYFQTIFSVFSSSSDASTCFQIETPSFYLVNGFALGTGAQKFRAAGTM